MWKDRIVELSHKIIEGKENFKLSKRVDDVTNILPEVKHRPDVSLPRGTVVDMVLDRDLHFGPSELPF